MQFAVIAEHPPQLCPTSNAVSKRLMKEGVQEIPQLVQELGIEIITLRVFGPEHIILGVVEAETIEAVRDLVFKSKMIQWNTTKIYATHSLEHAVELSDDLATVF